MLNPQLAAERLKEFSVDGGVALQKARIANFPGAFRESALALLGLKSDGTPFIQEGNYNSNAYQALNKARDAANKQLDMLNVAELETFFGAFFPRMGSLLAAWWKPEGSSLYQGMSNRRPFRMDRGAQTDEARQERRNILSTLISGFTQYQEMSLDWFAAWVPYLGAYHADTFSKLFAFAIDRNDELGDAVFHTLLESGKGEHEIGAMGRHVTRGLLSASREEGWEWVEKLLLAAQRQEGLRQSVLEVIDEANPLAFRRMLKLIRENDLFRFSATIRAADTWFGMNWVAYEKLSVKAANAATETVETFLLDPAGRDAVRAETTDGQTVYLALWATAFDDAHAALRAAVPLLSDPLLVRRYAALHLLIELRMKETRPAILAAFDDPDLRMSQKAFGAGNWYESADADGFDVLAVMMQEQNALVTEALEASENNASGAVATFFHGLKDAVSGLVQTLSPAVVPPPPSPLPRSAGEGELDAESVSTSRDGTPAGEFTLASSSPSPAERGRGLGGGGTTDDRFERIERNIGRFPVRAKELEPVIWEWDKLTAHAESLADRLPNLLGKRPVERLFPFVKMMSSYGRSTIASTIANRKDKTPEMRELLFDLFADAQSYVRDAALKAVDKFDITEPEAERIEGLLTRKAADLRKASLTLLLKRDDDAALASGERLTAARDSNQRVAGLDLLTQMVERKRQPARARGIVTAFVAARADKITPAEKAMTEPLTSDTHEKATLENALGLLDMTKLSRFGPPTMPIPVPDLEGCAATPILYALEALIEKHKEAEVKSPYSDEDTYLLGTNAYWFPSPRMDMPLETDIERLPLRDIWTDFWQQRPAELRDPDGRELMRAQVAKAKANEKKFNHSPIILDLLKWFERMDTSRDLHSDTEFILAAAEYQIVSVPESIRGSTAHGIIKGEAVDWRSTMRGKWNWYAVLQDHVEAHGDDWTPEQISRAFRLARYVDRPYKKAVSNPVPFALIVKAFLHGFANDADLYRALLPEPNARKENEYYREQVFNGLAELSGRKVPLFDTPPSLREIVDAVRRRVLEIELRRGDTETAASHPALALRYSGGLDVLVKTVAAFGKETFARGYSYYGAANRSNVFSRIIRATFPRPEDTFEAFAQAVKDAGIPEKRLVEIGVYAPQWAKHVAHTLGWDGLVEGIWWFHAHTKGNDWSVNAELKETWTAEIADKTSLTAADLTEGAVDVQWFYRVYAALGKAHWKMLDDAAKYASSAGGHKRAQLFADALRGNISRAELLARIVDKRNQDAIRALGLVPFADEGEDKDADLLLRYKALQELLRTSKTFGAQRQESEKLSTRIGMENLARTAGYADPIRLTWAMEAAAVEDLKQGAVTKTVGDVSVSLSINDLGMPELAVVKKGKTLANIPPAVKKDEEVATLSARKIEITRQVSRMRESLENAMCRGDEFSGKELGELLEHPVLRPLLRNMVFVEAEGREAVAGYPRTGEKGVTLSDHAHQTYAIAPDTMLRIAHPYDLLQTGVWDKWQKDCFLSERVQPFKQVFRELYVLTDSETTDGTKSRRYSGHQVNPKQALALFNKRGWIGGGEYDYDGDGPRKTFHEDGYTVSVSFMGYTATPADVEGQTLEEVRFTKKGEWKPVELKSVPPRVFSEAMRDLDLVVSVAHVGGVDPEASQSTTEMRAALLREMLGLLKIENVRLEKTHALIDGKLATYSIHLGSAVAHRQPGGYLCIVPVHSQHRGRIFLPFVDSDPRTAEVMSKVITLAKDSEIKDPTILEQILAVR